jgi:hypothetical protein
MAAIFSCETEPKNSLGIEGASMYGKDLAVFRTLRRISDLAKFAIRYQSDEVSKLSSSSA